MRRGESVMQEIATTRQLQGYGPRPLNFERTAPITATIRLFSLENSMSPHWTYKNDRKLFAHIMII